MSNIFRGTHILTKYDYLKLFNYHSLLIILNKINNNNNIPINGRPKTKCVCVYIYIFKKFKAFPSFWYPITLKKLKMGPHSNVVPYRILTSCHWTLLFGSLAERPESKRFSSQ